MDFCASEEYSPSRCVCWKGSVCQWSLDVAGKYFSCTVSWPQAGAGLWEAALMVIRTCQFALEQEC